MWNKQQEQPKTTEPKRPQAAVEQAQAPRSSVSEQAPESDLSPPEPTTASAPFITPKLPAPSQPPAPLQDSNPALKSLPAPSLKPLGGGSTGGLAPLQPPVSMHRKLDPIRTSDAKSTSRLLDPPPPSYDDIMHHEDNNSSYSNTDCVRDEDSEQVDRAPTPPHEDPVDSLSQQQQEAEGGW